MTEESDLNELYDEFSDLLYGRDLEYVFVALSLIAAETLVQAGDPAGAFAAFGDLVSFAMNEIISDDEILAILTGSAGKVSK